MSIVNVADHARLCKPNAPAIIKALGGNQNSGLCRCPAHDDRTPSLHVSERNGKALVKCHAGCSQQAVIGALRVKGLWPTDETSAKSSFVADPEVSHEKEAYKKLREGYRVARAAAQEAANENRGSPAEYFKGRGLTIVPKNAMLLSAKSARRFCNKPFPAIVFPIINNASKLQGAQITFLSRDGTKNLRSRDGNVRRIYGSASGGYVQLGEIDPDRPLIVAEGVEDALAASQLTGLPAIATVGTSNMATNCNPPACSEIIIAADNDEAGRKAAEAMAARMQVSVRIAFPPHGKDWNEALRSDISRDELRRILRRAPKFKRSDVRAVDLAEFIDLQFPPRQFLLTPWLRRSSVNMLDAQPGHGKTWLALSICYAIASGRTFLGWSVPQAARVLYVDGELPGELLQKRLQKLGPALPAGMFSILSRAQFEMRGQIMPDFATQEGRNYLDGVIEQFGADVVTLDSITTLFRSGDDNLIEDWRPIQDWLLKHQARGRAILLLHHHGRSGKPRGTSGREITIESRVQLTKDEALSINDDNETAFKVEFPKAREFFGADAAPMIAFLSTQSGTVEWRREELKTRGKEIEDQVRDLHARGLKQADIAKELGISQPTVCRALKRS